MRIRRTAGLAVALIVGLQILPSVLSATAAGPAYLTLLFSRVQWIQANSQCVLYPGAVPLEQVAQALSARGLTATGTVVVDRTGETDRLCENAIVYSGWEDLAKLRDSYGWNFVSHGMSYSDMTTLTPAQQQVESGGSLSPLADHGHDRAWGLFAYANNRFTNTIQRTVVSECFAYGRPYLAGTNQLALQASPWFADTNSITGGACNLPQPGDEVLVTVGSRLRTALRPPDTVGRLGGDEFVAVCEDVSGPAEVLALAQRLTAALEEPILVAGRELRIQASIGVAVSNRDILDPTAFLTEADGAIFWVKRRGEQVALFDDRMRIGTDEVSAGLDWSRPRSALPLITGNAAAARLVTRLVDLLDEVDPSRLDLRDPAAG